MSSVCIIILCLQQFFTTLVKSQTLPQVSITKQSYTGNAGDRITIDCEIRSPNSRIREVMWKFSNTAGVTTDPILMSLTFPLKYQGSSVYSPSLTINKLNSTDQGQYWCRATNTFGTASSGSTTLTVISDETESPHVQTTSTTVQTTSQTVQGTNPTVSATIFTVQTRISTVQNISQPVPATSQPVPATSPPVQATSQPVPATSQPAPATSTPVSATSQPVSATSQPVPTTSPPVPTTSPPVPATSPTILTARTTVKTLNATFSTASPEINSANSTRSQISETPTLQTTLPVITGVITSFPTSVLVSTKGTTSLAEANECEDKALNTCPQECVNTNGSFICRCWDGYIGENGRDCKLDYNDIETYLKTILVSVTVTDTAYKWDDSLYDISSEYYRNMESLIITTVNNMIQMLPGYREVKVISLRPGSIIVDFGIITTKRSNTAAFLNTIQQHVTAQTFGNITVKNETVKSTEGLGYISDMVMNTTVAVHEGSTQAVECLVDAISITGNVDFQWKLNGSVVKPTPASRLQILYNKMSNTRYNSTLLIPNISQRDVGIIVCEAVLGNYTEIRKTEINVYMLSIETSLNAVQIGKTITITCKVFPPINLAKDFLSMCKDGINLPDAQIEFTDNIAVSNLTYLMADTDVGCGWKYTGSCFKTINIHVFNPKILPCAAENKWKETFPGLTDQQPCLPGFTGLESRFCRLENNTGKWEEPNLVNCTRNVFVSLLDRLEHIEDGVQVDSLVNILNEVSNENKNLIYANDSTASDIRSSLEILTKASKIVTDREENITKQESVAFFSATDHILAENAKSSWEDLWEKTGIVSAAEVMNMVSKFNDKILKSLPSNESLIVIRENIVVEIKNTQIDDLIFPTPEILNKAKYFRSQVMLTRKTIQNSLLVNGSVQYTAVYYRTLSKLFLDRNSSQVNVVSPVIAFSIPSRSIKHKLNPPIQLTFETYLSNLTNRKCSYWNFDLRNGGYWTTDGCQTLFVNESTTECWCDHLTNFAVIVSLADITGIDHDVLSALSMMGCIISIICLTITLIIYIVEWKNLSSDKAVILVAICVTLLLTYIVFLAGINKTQNKEACTAIAILLHLMFLTVLFLMAAEGIIHAVLVVSVFPQQRPISKFLLPMAFGLAAAVVIISGGVTRLKGYGTSKFCWLAKETGLIYAFFVPCIAVVVMNLVITGLVMKKLFSTRACISKTSKEKMISGIRSIAILAPIFGLTWLFGLLSFSEEVIVFSYLFVICNSCQGLFIFLMHGICNPNVRKSIMRRISRLQIYREFTTTTKSESSNIWNKKAKTDDYIMSETNIVSSMGNMNGKDSLADINKGVSTEQRTDS